MTDISAEQQPNATRGVPTFVHYPRGSWRDQLAKGLLRIAGPRAMSQAVALPILVLLSLNISQAGYGETVKSGPDQVQTVFWAFVAGWVFFTVVGALIDRSFRKPSLVRSAVVIALFISTEIVRTTVVFLVATQLGLHPDAQWEVRIPAAASSGLIFFGIVSNVVNDTAAYRAIYRELFERRIRLASMLQASSETLEQTRSLLRKRVRTELENSLFGTIAEMRATMPRISLVIDQLFSIVDDVVRPTSHELFAAPVILQEKELTVKAPRVSAKTLIREATLAAPFRPMLTYVIFVVLFVPVIFALKDPFFVLPIVLATVPLFLVTEVARRLALPAFPAWPLSGRIILASAVYLFPAALLLGVMQVAFQVEANPLILIIYGGVLGLALGWGLAILAGLSQVREAMLAEVSLLNDELDWNLTRMQSQVWADQKSLALTLHSDIQGNLLAAAMKLRTALNTTEFDHMQLMPEAVAVIDEVKAMVAGVLEADIFDAETSSLEEIVTRLNATWDQLISMKIESDEAVLERVNADPVVLRVLDDILTEFQTNSVKHGKAKQTEVNLFLPQRGVLKVVLRNDGSREPMKSTSGLGMQFLQSVTLKYRFETEPVYQLTVQLPISH